MRGNNLHFMPTKARRLANQFPPRKRTEPVATVPSLSRSYLSPQPSGSAISSGRVYAHKASRFNPIRNLDPQRLTLWIDEFNGGYLRNYALLMDAIQSRDDVLRCVIPKRKLAVARREIEVITLDETPEAARHKEALEYFWENVTASDALELDRAGGSALLISQMMDAHAKRYAVHELLWKPRPQGLSCQFNFVPLYWFECRTGALRFLPHDLAIEGDPLEDGHWMVTVGEGLMEACSVAYMFKTLSLKDWVFYNEKHGSPGIAGKTKAPKGSVMWDNMVDAVSKIASNFSVVIGMDDAMEKIDFSAEGQLPYPPLVERMDRAMAAIWRGADLSTISAGQGTGQGASLQGDESDLVEAGDALMLSETFQIKVERRVIAYTFGEGVMPLAYGRVMIPPKQDVDADIKIDEFLVAAGVPVGVTDTLERYGRPMPDDDEQLLEKKAAPMMQFSGGGAGRFGGNGNGGERGSGSGNGGGFMTEDELRHYAGRTREAANCAEDRALLKRTREELAKTQAAAFKPLRERVEGILELTNEDAFRAALDRLRSDAPNLIADARPGTAAVIERALTAGEFNRRARRVVCAKPTRRRVNP